MSRWRKTKTKCRGCGAFYERCDGVTRVAHSSACPYVNPFKQATLCSHGRDVMEMHGKGGCPECNTRQARIRELEANRPRLIDYLKMKQDSEDWHGVQDAASDLRDLDSELDGLRY